MPAADIAVIGEPTLRSAVCLPLLLVESCYQS